MEAIFPGDKSVFQVAANGTDDETDRHSQLSLASSGGGHRPVWLPKVFCARQDIIARADYIPRSVWSRLAELLSRTVS